ncbi:MAG: type II secretion system major pseudopilin GspG [SAR324 cluster bacterium]|nr:type II secretion system major pseudopilin GspG [SAR324 cluster bacterium]MCZ6729845.1 type II secretion system major pseudopilin GspG [SAR324 cluster bacterium]MCZ6844156.1 type II secretion system major pseudopilin GspG [SAR324 cluster bacterium]
MNTQPSSAPGTAMRLPGFTFIEILVVLIILALIAGIVGTQLLGEAEKAKSNTTKIQMKSLEAALDLYRLHNSTYPTTEQGLGALITKPEVGRIPRDWQGPYLNSNSVPGDGWKNPFVFESDGKSFAIKSLGADATEGGTDLDADISNKDL